MQAIMPVIQTDQLTKDYLIGFWRKVPRRSLDSLTIEIQGNEIFGFLGPNGAGKTTTIKLLMDLVFPTSGTGSILGRPLGDVRMHRRIGYLPEQPYFYDYLTAGELLDYFARFFGYQAGERRKRVDTFLERVGLASSRDLQLRKFSKGMLQRVGLAQAILHDPEVVILDEPMSGLDPIGRREVRDLILELKKEGRTVFFSTHILHDAETLCDRLAVLAGGRLQGIGTIEELVSLQVQGVEIIFELSGGASLPPGFFAGITRTGDRYRVEVPEQDVYAALDRLRHLNARLIGLVQVRPTLEDYFFGLVKQVKQAGGG
jgi:ABC-2 type transport system ATP-binding protein